MEKAPNPVKFGLLSIANITNVIADAIKAIPEAECAAVASRDINKAKAFAKKHNIPKACSYSELLTLPIDAVYIPLPTSMIAGWAIPFAKAGKHVIVDKPLGSTQTVQDIMEECEKADVVFLDGTHFVHSARTKEIQRRIAAGDIGDVCRVEASFSVPVPAVAENIRFNPTLEPQTFLGDLGWYCARAAVAYLGAELTSSILSVTCTATLHPRFPGCVQRGCGVVLFGTEARTVPFCYSFDSACTLHQRVALIGNLGMLEELDFVIPPTQSAMFQNIRPAERYSTATEYTFERTVERIDSEDEIQMAFPCRDRIIVKEDGNLTLPQAMIREFCRLILEEDKKSAKRWAQESLATQAILDAMAAKLEI